LQLTNINEVVDSLNRINTKKATNVMYESIL